MTTRAEIEAMESCTLTQRANRQYLATKPVTRARALYTALATRLGGAQIVGWCVMLDVTQDVCLLAED